MQRDLKHFGHTELGCPRCHFVRTHGNVRGCGYAHSIVCRSRIKTDFGERLAKGVRRLRRFDEKWQARHEKLEREEEVLAACGYQASALAADQHPAPLKLEKMHAKSSRHRLNKMNCKDYKYMKMHQDGVVRLKFACSLYEKQVKAGRYFLHGHTAQADSWSEACIEEVMKLDRVDSIVVHQRPLGQSDGTGGRVKTPTRWMSNVTVTLNWINVKCSVRVK